MKKHLIILSSIVAAASFASCTKEVLPTVEENGMEIGFNAVAQKATKADGAIVTSTTFPEDNTFKVWGYYDKDATAADAINYSNTSDFMKGVKISYTTNPSNPDNKAWRNSEKSYYWPNTGAIDFVAVAPSTITTSDDSKDGFKVNDYTIAAAADATDKTRTTDLMYGHAAGMNRTTALPLAFTHALSQIAINIKTNSDYKTNDGAEFYVDSVKINNIDLSGDLTYTRSTDTGAWSDNTDLNDVLVYSTTRQEAVYSATNGTIYTNALVMIPQTFNTYVAASGSTPASGSKAQFEISYTLKQANSDEQSGTVYVDVPMSKVGSASSSYVWAIQTKYTYILNFKLNEITFSPSVNAWVEAQVVTSDIQ